MFKQEFNEIEVIFKKYNNEVMLDEVKKVFRSISTILDNRLNKIKPSVSIIVPVYNVEEYLDDCLISLMSQTYENIQIFCIDDCSEDSSLEILEYYQKLDNRIKIIKNRINSGLSVSRNKGINVATGKYLMFVDSDDWLDKQSIEKLVYCAEKMKLKF